MDKLINHLTILIPTHNRHQYLKRVILSLSSIDVPKIIIDSSEIEWIDAQNYRLNGLIHDYVRVKRDFPNKILEILPRIKTKFCLMLADDDFIDIRTLSSIILTNNQSSILGKTLLFNKNYNGILYSGNSSFATDYGQDKKYNTEMFFSNYQNVLWGVHPTQLLLVAFQILTSFHLTNDNFIEFVIAALMVGEGNFKVIDQTLNLREYCNEKHWGNQTKSLFKIRASYLSNEDFNQIRFNIDKLYGEGFTEFCMKKYLDGFPESSLFRKIIKRVKNLGGKASSGIRIVDDPSISYFLSTHIHLPK